MKERYHISGMTCSACSSHVQKAVEALGGMEKASVNLLTETMEVIYDEHLLTSADIIEAVEKAGYGATGMDGTGLGNSEKEKDGLERQQKEEEKTMKWRLGLSILFLLPLMYVAMCLQMHSTPANAMTYAMTQLFLLLPILYLNRKFFAVGFKTLSHLAPNMDSLIALGASAALGYGVFALYRISYGMGHGEMTLVERYSHDLYFESAGMILTLITVGKYLEERSKGKTTEAIKRLMDLSPKLAVVVDENGMEKEIPTHEVQRGDVFLVKPGSLVPVDGTILEGFSGIDESAITGESIPVEKRPGDKVISATLNKAGFLKCRADRVGEDTTLSQIIRLVEEANAGKAPIARMADRVAGVFVPAVMGIALLTFIGWMLAGQTVEFAISTAIAVLVISCPCALGLATPVAIMVGTGVGAKNGILIKSGEALQIAGSIDTVVLDKTGTITEGRLKVMGVYGYEKGIDTKELLSVAAALEKMSEHPLAEAVIKEAESFEVKLPGVSDFTAVFGRGVQGIPTEGRFAGVRVFVGNRAYMEENGIEILDAQSKLEEHIAGQGETPLWIGIAGERQRVVGFMALADEIKSSSYKAVKAFKKQGIRVAMLTGDNERTALAVKERLGIEEVFAQVLPQDKERHIRNLQAQGRKVAMIGDGINDAPALAAADVGMAIGAGTDVAMESADIVLIKNDLRDAVTAVSLSRRVIRNIKQNLFWAFFYNSIGIPLAAGLLYPVFGLRLSPMFGAAAMSFSSVFVVGNALRLRRFRGIVKVTGAMHKKTNVTVEDVVVKEEDREMIITIEGMMCGHCTGRVQKVLEQIPGVKQVVMSLENKTATVSFTKEVPAALLKAAITEAGYEVTDIKVME
ncbi:MAG: heavy metal translocating P-type ATPase [Lachnospiraceae bacterium]|nr:heavy metal translocating P-type ATPase [Lachnospiraceae bacterium]